MEAHEHSGAADALYTSAIGDGGGAGVDLPASPLFSSPTDFIASLFPLLVLAVCVSAISSSAVPLSSHVSLLHPSSLFNALKLHLAVLRHHLPTRFFISSTLSPPFLFSFVLPFVSFLLFRVFPLLSGSPHGPLPASTFWVSYSILFSLPATAALSSSYSTTIHALPSRPHPVLGAFVRLASLVRLQHFKHDASPDGSGAAGRAGGVGGSQDIVSLDSLSPLLRLLLHPAYISRRSVIFWLLVEPFLLYGCILHIYLHQRDAALASTAATTVSTPPSQASASSISSRLFFRAPYPALRSTVAVSICLFIPSVVAAAAIHWFANPAKGTQQAFQYVGVEGALYALTFLVAFYDPIVHSGMFSTARTQYMGPFHIRGVTSFLAFIVFLFTPPPFDLYLLLGGMVAAALAAAAAAAPPLLTLFTCTAAAALLHPSLFKLPHNNFGISLPWSSSDGHSWSAGGLALTLAVTAASTGVICNYNKLLQAADQYLTRLSRTTRRCLAAVFVFATFLLLPFSYLKQPSLSELLLQPRVTTWSHGGRSLYDITCNGTTALGSVAAKVIAFWLPLFVLQGRIGEPRAAANGFADVLSEGVISLLYDSLVYK